MLSLRLLGQPEVTWAGQPLALERRQVRALLYRLAASSEPVSREELGFLFWSESPESAARQNLRVLLSHLRRSLPVADLVQASAELVELDPHRSWVDTRAFEGLREGGSDPGQAAALEQAVGLYGGPFLAGFSLPGCPEFEMWVTTRRQTWERLYLEMLAVLVQDLTARGQYPAAIAQAQRYLATDELAEGMHRRLIELHTANLDRSAALRQYRECATILERELGVSPLPRTQAAYRAALAGQVEERSTATSQAPWSRLPGLEVPLVGRDAVLERLEQTYARACAGHGGVVLVSGEAGIGKSRLMQEFTARVQDTALVLSGTGHPDAQMTPYLPIIEMLRQALGAQEMARATPAAWLAEASRLLPELRDLVPSLPAPLPVEPDLARTRLFEALCQILVGLMGSSRPALLCLDDLHWADATTLDWLGYLGRRLHGKGLLVLGAYQVEEAATVARLRRSLDRWGILSELSLAPLDQAAVQQLLDHLGPLPGRLGATHHELYAATGGNPFFLLETIGALMEASAAAVGQQAGMPEPQGSSDRLAERRALPLPKTIQAAVRARAAGLSAGARQVLEAGAVLGWTLSFEDVQLTAGRSEMETLEALEELLARRLFDEEGNRYHFRHQVVRRAIYHDLGARRRSLLHRRAGDALEGREPGDAHALARHFELGGDLGRAARYSLQAGQAAKAVFGHAEARAHFDRALSLLERESAAQQGQAAVEANQRLTLQALYERGWALRLLGEMEAYSRDLQEVVRLAESLDDPCTLAHLRWRQAYAHRWFCRYADAQQAAEEGLRLLRYSKRCTALSLCQDEGFAGDRRAGRCPFEAFCWREIGMAAREMGDHTGAETALTGALDRFSVLGATGYKIHTLGNLSTLYWRQGQFERAREMALQELDCCEEAQLELERRLPLGDLGAAAAALGEADRAEEALSESLALARRIDDRTQEIFCLGHLGWLGIGQMQPAQALVHLGAALALAGRINSCAERSWLLSGLAEAHRLAGDEKAARASAQAALETAMATNRRHDQEVARRILDSLAAS